MWLKKKYKRKILYSRKRNIRNGKLINNRRKWNTKQYVKCIYIKLKQYVTRYKYVIKCIYGLNNIVTNTIGIINKIWEYYDSIGEWNIKSVEYADIVIRGGCEYGKERRNNRHDWLRIS